MIIEYIAIDNKGISLDPEEYQNLKDCTLVIQRCSLYHFIIFCTDNGKKDEINSLGSRTRALDD